MNDMEYKGWNIHSFKQVHYPPFLDWCCIAKKYVGDKSFVMFNVEGNTSAESIRLCKQQIDERESNASFRSS